MEAQSRQRLETIVAILIAAATVIGAVVAWRSSIADDSGGDADFAGLRASVNAEETRALNNVNAYESYAAYASYWRYNELGNLIEGEIEQASPEEADALQRQLSETRDLAISSQRLFPNKFLDRDGSYNVKRQLGELWADAARERDLNPDPQYAEADQFRSKANWFLVAVTILAVALVLYTLVEAVGDRARYVMVALGSLCLVVGTVFALYVEFRM